MTEQKGGLTRAVGALQVTAALAALILLAAKGLGLGVNWLTILGVLAIPGAISAVFIVVVTLVAVIIGLIQVFDHQ